MKNIIARIYVENNNDGSVWVDFSKINNLNDRNFVAGTQYKNVTKSSQMRLARVLESTPCFIYDWRKNYSSSQNVMQYNRRFN